MQDNDCAICCDAYKDFAKYGCGHRLCYKCAARLLYLYNDRKCPICKESRSKPVFDSVTEESQPEVSDFSRMADIGNTITNELFTNDINREDAMKRTVTEALPTIRQTDSFTIRETDSFTTQETGLTTSKSTTKAESISMNNSTAKHRLIDTNDLSFVDDQISPKIRSLKINGDLEDSYATYADNKIHKKVKDLLIIKCKNCKQVFTTRKELITHFRAKHSALLCSTCLENNHQFWYEYSNYTPESLSHHRKGQLKEPGFDGHVFCVFCSFYLYNKDTPKKHCNQEHQLCTVCDILGCKLQYYRNFTDLEAHYRSQHFCCSNPVCIKNLCYVYSYKSELWAHSISHHGLEMQLSDINLKNEKNPSVFSLFEKKESVRDEESVYRTGVNVSNPLVNSPFFPTFFKTLSNAIPNNIQSISSEIIPSFLNRSIVHQEEASNKQRINLIKNITPAFCSEKSSSIEKYISGVKSLVEMVSEVEEGAGRSNCLRILETVPFLQKQKEIREFLVEYKKELKFPTFKKIPSKIEPLHQKKASPIGFKILDASKIEQKR